MVVASALIITIQNAALMDKETSKDYYIMGPYGTKAAEHIVLCIGADFAHGPVQHGFRRKNEIVTT